MIDRARRTFLVGGALLPITLFAPWATATLMRGLPLRSLCAQSQHVLLVTALAARCTSLAIGGRAMIVTETTVHVEDLLSKAAPSSAQIVVRTLGGVLDGLGELVHGQAQLSVGERCVAFLTHADDGALWVTGMAQGHYPLIAVENAEARLSASPRLSTLRDFEYSAVRELVGQNLTRARALIARASAR